MPTNPDPAQPRPGGPDGLSIGDLGRRTGLSPATLRAWETRHGFPVPQRRESGHRRYDERDVAAVRRVLALREAGVRLEVAVAEVVAARESSPAASVFAELRRGQPHLAPQQLRKATLLALTWAMEDECCARAQRPALFGAFQHERYYRQAEERWDELGRTARSTVVFADFSGTGTGAGTGAGSGKTSLVHLPEEAPMRREWSLVCDSAEHPAALAAWELPGQRGVRDKDRVFESLWTVEPRAVRAAARACTDLAETLSPGAAARVGSLDGVPAEAGEDVRAASALFARVLRYTDRLQ